jgi:hypothetical protein
MGDCAIGLGRVAVAGFPYETIPVEMSGQGVLIEEA